MLCAPFRARRALRAAVRRSSLQLLFSCGVVFWCLGGVAARAQLSHAGEHRITLTSSGFSYTTDDKLGSSIAVGDFDGDGIDDAAFGLPGHVVSGQSGAGAVLVVYGSDAGLGRTGARSPVLLTQTATGDDTSEADDGFGFALTAADFNGNGQDDLVVGVPYEDFSRSRGGTWTDAGVVHVFWGTASGLVATTSDLLTPDDYTCTEDFFDGLEFGYALASRDRDGDPNEDLVIGMPGANRPEWHIFDSVEDAGSIFSLTGNATLGLSGGFCWAPWDELSPGSRFGSAIALGDTNDGGSDNEAIVGAPFGDDAVLNDDNEGLMFQYPVAGFLSQAGADGDLFGSAVATGDFQGLGYHQVLVGAPESDVAGPSSAGRVRLYDDGAPGASFEQGTGALLESAEGFDRFGQVLGVGDFNHDGYDDAVFGVPGENLDDLGANKLDAGVVHVQYGDTAGLDAGASQLFHWDDGAFELWTAVGNDRFGAAVGAGDFDGDGVDDLAIGAATASSGGPNRGIIQVLYGVDATPIFVDGFESGSTSAGSP